MRFEVSENLATHNIYAYTHILWQNCDILDNSIHDLVLVNLNIIYNTTHCFISNATTSVVCA